MEVDNLNTVRSTGPILEQGRQFFFALDCAYF